jgi:hypothetical protein
VIGSKIEFAGSARGLICMISADVLAAEKRELSKLDELESEIQGAGGDEAEGLTVDVWAC